jgi:hypothetical protein
LETSSSSPSTWTEPNTTSISERWGWASRNSKEDNEDWDGRGGAHATVKLEGKQAGIAIQKKSGCMSGARDILVRGRILGEFSSKTINDCGKEGVQVPRRNGTCILYIDVQTRTIWNIIGTWCVRRKRKKEIDGWGYEQGRVARKRMPMTKQWRVKK